MKNYGAFVEDGSKLLGKKALHTPQAKSSQQEFRKPINVDLKYVFNARFNFLE